MSSSDWAYAQVPSGINKQKVYILYLIPYTLYPASVGDGRLVEKKKKNIFYLHHSIFLNLEKIPYYIQQLSEQSPRLPIIHCHYWDDGEVVNIFGFPEANICHFAPLCTE
ncbi:hypothetical protein OTU49_016029 [Cherax quadricarinatus]|uniref:Uncharacterized protein n=1 Tax=Cherax quadricarinatus TaxID=27406 RepID=A0AAW0YA17_CHEQU